MTCRSPLAMVLRDVRHGRAALAAGYVWRARLAVATAEGHLTRGFEALRALVYGTGVDDFEGQRRLFHRRARVRLVRRLLDTFAIEVERQLPCELNAKSKEKRHG